MRDQKFVAARHIEINCRRHAAKQFEACAKERGRWLSRIDVERASVVEDEIEIAVAAGSVIPRGPVDHHQRIFLQHGRDLAFHLRIGAEHAVRVDHGFRHAGGTGGEEIFRDSLPADVAGRGENGVAPAAVASEGHEIDHLS